MNLWKMKIFWHKYWEPAKLQDRKFFYDQSTSKKFQEKFYMIYDLSSDFPHRHKCFSLLTRLTPKDESTLLRRNVMDIDRRARGEREQRDRERTGDQHKWSLPCDPKRLGLYFCTLMLSKKRMKGVILHSSKSMAWINQLACVTPNWAFLFCLIIGLNEVKHSSTQKEFCFYKASVIKLWK